MSFFFFSIELKTVIRLVARTGREVKVWGRVLEGNAEPGDFFSHIEVVRTYCQNNKRNIYLCVVNDDG